MALLASMKFKLTRTSDEAWKSIIQDIREATQSIEIELFIVDVDDVGIALLQALREKAREGVKVKLIADAGGSYIFYLSTLGKEVRADGVEISFFNHIIPWYPKNLKLLYFRDHRRTVIIDSKIAYTGGVCFSNNMAGWRDTMIRIEEHDAIDDMQKAFKRMWSLSEHRRFSKRHRPNNKDALYLTNAPVPGRGYLYKKFISLIKEAQKEITLTTPYFVPNAGLFKALQKALKRGVDVRLLVPHQSNHSLTDRAGDFQKAHLLKHGMKIYPYKEMILHAKAATFDDATAIIGSMNLDNISLGYNFEGGLIITDPECVKEVRAHFEEDTKDIKPITLEEWKKRPLKQKLLAYLMWPFQKLL